MKKATAALALALASIALVACGGGDSNPTTTTNAGGGEAASGGAGGGKAEGAGENVTVKFEADPGGALAYTTKQASAKAGKATIEFTNPQPATHDVAIEDSSGKAVGKTELIAESSTSTAVNLKPGSYTFYCSVPGHRDAGMEGALTVK